MSFATKTMIAKRMKKIRGELDECFKNEMGSMNRMRLRDCSKRLSNLIWDFIDWIEDKGDWNGLMNMQIYNGLADIELDIEKTRSKDD